MMNFLVIDNKKELDLPILLKNLKKACGLWFLNEKTLTEKDADQRSYTSSNDNIITTTVEILRHGLRLTLEDAVAPSNSTIVSLSRENLSLNSAEGLKKMVDEFEWVCRSAQIRDLSAAEVSTDLRLSPNLLQTEDTSSKMVSDAGNDIECFLHSWVHRNLKAKCLSACLQVLVSEKEMLNTYYREYAFLQNEEYSTALFICLSALELNQLSLLSQIDTELCSPSTVALTVPSTSRTKYRRTTSHPLFSISPVKSSCSETINDKEERRATKTALARISVPILPTFRKTRSLPELQYKPNVSLGLFFDDKPRPRSKTMLSKYSSSSPQDIVANKSSPNSAPYIAINTKMANESGTIYSNSNTTTNTTTTGSSYSGSDFADLAVSSTSPQSIQQINLSAQVNVGSSTTASTPSLASSLNMAATRRIELINCDDIQIWTDQAYDESRSQQSGKLQQEAPTTAPCTIPQSFERQKHKTKSLSPIGSFLCNLFSTPPMYTHWSIENQNDSFYGVNLSDGEHHNTTTAAAAAIFPCNLAQHTDNSPSSSGGVFDSFMPVYGKKLRSRNSQSLFEDGISTLDYKVADNEASKTVKGENGVQTAETCKTLPKYQQSLTDFLQTSQMSRNNTDLEKENAHFRVSEAIISAIEHIKWDNSMAPEKKLRRRKVMRPRPTATTATDCLAVQNKQKPHWRARLETESSHDESSEHIPYAELGESCLDLLSAEVVGLSIISKFNDKHLPKVSELKWLVSEDDTPQQLLPMPDNSPTANPDDNVIRPLTRGTRYWAPPRQQIIFTNHPPSSRKELIQKQNNRCAGCGMRVSRQYINSFRYCTYLGKYHCTGCHRNQISPIPAKIINFWDFKYYPVSVFSYRLLEQMYTYPLFYMPDLNPALYIENKSLLSARKKRVHLKYVKDFVKTCRFAVREQVYFDSIPEHITNDPDIWSLSDFIDVHNKSMQRSIDQLIENCEDHIFNCVLCTARGFHCEFCQKDQVIYPWQQKVFRCDRCGSCFHLNCWKSLSDTCCRCQRISKRQEITVT